MKQLLLSIAIASAATVAYAQGKQVTVINHSAFERTAEPITISIDESKDIKSATVSHNGMVIPCQLDDIDGNGVYDQLFFVTSLGKKQKKVFNVTLSRQESESASTQKVYAQMMLTNKKIKSSNKQDLYINSLSVDNGTNPYWMLHHHGPAFENELVAYRIYFDERQTVDIYGKYKKGLELRETQFYPDSMQKANGFGDDILWVGKTFGLGAMRGWANEQPQMLQDVEKRTLSIVAAGPLRTIVKVEDRGWNPYYPKNCKNNERITMTTLYTLSTGRRECKVDITLKGNTEGLRLSTGLVNVKDSKEFTDSKGLRGCWGTDWPVSAKDSVGHKRETVGLGICLDNKNVVEEKPADKDNYTYVVSPQSDTVSYYITFASDNETYTPSYHSATEFFNYLKQWKKTVTEKVSIEIKDFYM